MILPTSEDLIIKLEDAFLSMDTLRIGQLSVPNVQLAVLPATINYSAIAVQLDIISEMINCLITFHVKSWSRDVRVIRLSELQYCLNFQA